ncbi:BREX system P-loop protein BrxC [Pelotomaculum terephthalicicum JT]|uniref:BREX system P-loop protein BrxC n=1 Tax=Pelotomaculum terephthalicicum TaxID=206393 RepID=UPI001F0401DF|nr:BREX system P-loop protein BrxC [Pelotomaculum terephthalicicum]MCG9969222.1 BREX system P-loop protein BrxC [Pelotomaculum terephthalicicum JT]
MHDMFQKDIDRPIQGVVKIGQDSNEIITAELEEYVVTKELHRHFDKFFEGYRKGTTTRTDKMGVWISGFFGSGKSHFLKILSYLLSNRTYNGKKAISYFDGKIADSRILADMQVAADTSADVVLFNIDAEADADSKTKKDAIVKVFMKVFNKMRGFCGSMPWIADLERQMTKDGVYDSFCARFKELAGNEWEETREDFYFEEDNIVQALADTTKMSIDGARNWYNKSEENYSLDINGFARRVREYIEAKSKETGKKHFVIFLCDEMGQYIGGDSGLMLNLQTVVESLGTECGGQAWVIATSQQDIDSITKVDRDNFSKIIGRFDTRLSLSSANVDEVIKKRLLAKTDAAADKLRLLYAGKAAVIKNLITFSSDTPEKRLYSSAEEFVDVYPFIPYQFNLLQAVFTGIRTHGASGKHLSEGERSLLNAFQEAAVQYANFDDCILIPFNAFYRTIETFLDHNIKAVIIRAAESAEFDDGALQPYDVEILKVLFMVKYIPNVLPANLENITTVMLGNIDQDKIEAKKQVDASLRRLEEQKLIIKNGNQFIFLTNEEQDINREIREIKIDTSEIIDKVGDDIFSTLFGLNKKYRYNDRYDFSFNTIIDDRPRGAQKEEIGIRVLTPMYAHGGAAEPELKAMSMRERNVIVALPSDMSFIDEMEQALQIETYIRRNAGKASTDAVEDIKTTKTREGKQRLDRCKELIFEALKKADLYVNGYKLDIKEKQPSERINDAFKILVEGIYTKQNYITNPFYTNDNLREILTAKDTQVVIEGMEAGVPNHLAIEEVKDIVARSSYKNMPTTMRTLMDHFNKIPYGWKDMDIAGIVLTLFQKQEIRLELGGESIVTSDMNVINYVTKRDYLDRVLVKMRVKISPVLLQNAKNLAKDVFGRSDIPGDEDGLMARFKELASSELSGNDGSIKDLLHEYDKAGYPGKTVLENGRKLFEQAVKIKETTAFYNYLAAEKDALLDYGEDVQDVKKFFKNQRKIFDKALKMLAIYEANRSYVLDPETIKVVEDIERITRLPEPYAEIHKLPELIERFIKRFGDLLEAECEPVRTDIEADKAATLADLERRSFKERFSGKVQADFSALLDRLSHANNIYEAIAMRTESDRMKQRFMQGFDEEEARLAAEQAKAGDDVFIRPPVRKTKTVSVKTLFHGTSQISSKEDIDRLLDELRKKLEAQLEENTTIKIV